MAEYGIIVTKDGYDARLVEQKETSFSSLADSLIVYKKTEEEISVEPNGTNSLTIEHGLGYIPLTIGFFKNPKDDNWQFMSSVGDIADSDGGGHIVFSFLKTDDLNKLLLRVERIYDSGGNSVTIPIRIFILTKRYE